MTDYIVLLNTVLLLNYGACIDYFSLPGRSEVRVCGFRGSMRTS